MKDLLSIVFVLIAIVLLLILLGVNVSSIFGIVEWNTKFILPWLGLFWLVKMVKALDEMSISYNKKIQNDEV